MSSILGLETSCDETAAAVVSDGRTILSTVVASQVDLHRKYGGVFPEIASRQHVLDIVPVIQETMSQAKADWAALQAIAVTSGPGLVGSLLVGVNFAKALAWATGLPLVGVNHLEAHLYANWLTWASDSSKEMEAPPLEFPLLCLIVSGGHTDLVLMTDHGVYRVLGRTVDDAAGEAFDKVARLLELGYPGGPAIQAAAETGDAERFELPRAMLKRGYDFSFSGLKTAVLRIVKKYEHGAIQVCDLSAPADQLPVADLAASFQAAIVDVLVQKTRHAAQQFEVKEVLLAGGVASNRLLRQRMKAEIGTPVRYPPPVLCTDNAAMVASAGYFKYRIGQRDGLDLDVEPHRALTGVHAQ